MFQIRKAERKQAKLRLGISAPSGAGKTHSSIVIAKGMGGKIGLIDTENRSADLYCDLADYDVITLTAPYSPERYVQAIETFERAKYDTIIIDSLSHAWVGTGGSLEKHSNAVARDPKGNTWSAWREITPAHNQLVDKLTQSPCHIIATMRAKTETVMDKDDSGKIVIRKVGMSPVMRDGIEYEFTLFLEMDQRHNAFVSKTRIPSFDGKVFIPSERTGEELIEWLNQGTKDYTQDFEVLKKSIRDNPLQDLTPHADTLAALKEQEPETYTKVMKYIESHKPQEVDNG